ncbi:hypothetical protein WMO79_01070 [Micrococcaceae bacterium Sec7.4]
MDTLESTARAIRGRRNRTKELADRERDLRSTSWWDLPERLSLRSSIAVLHRELGEYTEKITPENLQQLAEYAGAQLWSEAAAIVTPGKNPFGPAARDRFDAILQASLENLGELQLPVSQWPIPVADLPDLAAILTPTFIESNANRIFDARRAVAESTEYLYERCDDGGKAALIIQHKTSGLRARFTLTAPGFGTVYSKPYDIDSIDPDRPGKLVWWESYVGLGIGRGIYSEAHRLSPEIRWRTSTLSDHSRALRRKLHVGNPYIWAGHCEWCDRNLSLGWEKSTPASFAAHP